MKHRIFNLALIFSILSITLSAKAAICSNKIDPKKVILFVTTNPTLNEVIAAREAACLRGEKLILIPDLTDEQRNAMEKSIKVADQSEHQLDGAQKALHKLNKDLTNLKSKNNSKLKEKKIDQLQNRVNILRGKTNDLNDKSDAIIENIRKKEGIKTSSVDQFYELLDEKLKLFDKENVQVSTLMLSGHDGGGKVSGKLGTIGIADVLGLYNNHKALKNMESIYLLGCNTAGPAEVFQWSKQIPSLKWLIGYSDSAPLSFHPKSASYIREMMLAEKKSKKVSSEKDLKLLLNKFQSIKENYAGGGRVCDGKVIEFHTNERRGYTFTTQSLSDETISCPTEVIKELNNNLIQYFFGNWDMLIPKDTETGRLRGLYTLTRQFEPCMKASGSLWSGDRAALMLFFENIKKNFEQTFREKTLKAKVAYQDFSPESINQLIISTAERHKKKVEELRKEKEELQLLLTELQQSGNGASKNYSLNRDLDEKQTMLRNAESRENDFKLITKLDTDNFKPLWFPEASSIGSLTRKELSKISRNWDSSLSILNNYRNYLDQEHQEKLNILSEYQKKIKNYLWDLNPECMDFLEWYEFKEGKRVKEGC